MSEVGETMLNCERFGHKKQVSCCSLFHSVKKNVNKICLNFFL